jgi:hypothetical protein
MAIKKRDYYSIRTGRFNTEQQFTLETLKKLFLAIYDRLKEEGYYHKYFGFLCAGTGYIHGELGSNVNAAIFLHLKKENLWPITEKIDFYSEDDLFDIIEFMTDHTSKPLDGDYHSYNNCGVHYTSFDDDSGQKRFTQDLNYILKDYNLGYEISAEGEIFTVPETGLRTLLEANVTSRDEANIKEKVETAVLKFRRHKSTWDQRRDAVRDLADVLEFLRDKAKLYMKGDEADLFNIANNFGIRHHNPKQKTDYDQKIWYPWIFYYYLSTIHALLRIIEKNEPERL